MSLFSTDSICLSYNNLDAAKQWWLQIFECKFSKVPPDWDAQLPSDIALALPGEDDPAILLSAAQEVDAAGLVRPNAVTPIIFCQKIQKAHELLSRRGASVGPIQSDAETEFFEVRDLEGNAIEICKEP